ncbi:MAG: sensor histidine kinase [Steroidobacteraceae bacterium]
MLFGWPRIRFTLAASILIGLVIAFGWKSGLVSLLVRTISMGLVAMIVFGLFERWPKRLPRRLARWTLQVLGVALAMPLTVLAIYIVSTDAGAPPFWQVPDRLTGFGMLTVVGLLFAPWAALGALVRQKDALARHQALAFDLERSEFERQALDSRLRLLQAQVTPHFLFNTLANIQALVDTGSPQASTVLRSLVAYLRAAVPRLDEPVSTIAHEIELVRAYLELMHMRIPDRLQYAVRVDDAAQPLRCPPMSLLTLVENAVRHGIDPSEVGGRIEIDVQRRGERCIVRVSDTGVGSSGASAGLGTGLTTLRERLALIFGADAHLNCGASSPHGYRAELDLPAQGGAPIPERAAR